MNEQKLVALCKNGDAKALESLYEKYAALMMGISMRYIGNADGAKDTVHDSFLKIFEAINRFEYKGEGSLRAWIGRIVANTAITRLRKSSDFTSKQELDAIAEPEDDHSEDEKMIVLYEAVSDETIIRYVGKLPKRLRVVFNLFMFEDVSHSDIARQLDISESASRVRLHRAKALLAGALQEHINRMNR